MAWVWDDLSYGGCGDISALSPGRALLLSGNWFRVCYAFQNWFLVHLM